MTAFNYALLVGGAATALLAGVATAEFGLAPARQEALRAEAAPSPDTVALAAAAEPTQADLSSAFQVSPPAVTVPVHASTPPEPVIDIADGRASRADEDVRQGDDRDARAMVARDPAQEFDRAPEAGPEARTVEQDRDPSIQAVGPPAEDPLPVTPG